MSVYEGRLGKVQQILSRHQCDIGSCFSDQYGFEHKLKVSIYPIDEYHDIPSDDIKKEICNNVQRVMGSYYVEWQKTNKKDTGEEYDFLYISIPLHGESYKEAVKVLQNNGQSVAQFLQRKHQQALSNGVIGSDI